MNRHVKGNLFEHLVETFFLMNIYLDFHSELQIAMNILKFIFFEISLVVTFQYL